MPFTPKEFVLFAVVAVLAVVLLPVYSLVSMDLFSRFVLQRNWELGGVLFDQADVFTIAILLAVVFRVKGLRQAFWEIPRIRLWIALGILLSVAYLLGPGNREGLTGPLRILYQLYRYCWKEILFLPLAVILITDDRRARVVLLVLLSAADLCAVQAIIEGYQGYRTGGFLGPNHVGSAFALPVSFALGMLIWPRKTWETIFSWVSLLLIARGALFSGSRGSFIALFCSVAFLLAMASRDTLARRRIVRMGLVLLFAMSTLLATNPDISDRPTITRALTATKPMEQGTLLWRISERWPYFFDLVKAHPWFGTGGSAVAEELGDSANTPHQGYIEFAVRSGIPASILVLFLLLSGLLAGLRVFLASVVESPSKGVIALSCSAAIVGIMVHNLAESTISVEVVSAQVWLAVGLGLSWSGRLAAGERKKRS